MDTKDSIEKVERIANELIKSSNLFKKMRVVCLTYNKDNFVNYHNKPIFHKANNYQVEYYYINDKSASRLNYSGKLVLINKRGKVLATSSYLGNFNYRYKPESTTLKAKLLTEKTG